MEPSGSSNGRSNGRLARGRGWRGAGGGEEAIGFCSIGAAEFGGPGWPFACTSRPMDVASVSRVVLLAAARGRGALPHLLRPCALFHALGIPVRIATRKREVAEKALGKLVGGSGGVLRVDDAPRRLRLTRAANERAAVVTALVPFMQAKADAGSLPAPASSAAAAGAAAATPESFQRRLVNAPKERGKNDGWHFWYVGCGVVHAGTGETFAFVGGLRRFAPLCETGLPLREAWASGSAVLPS